MKEINKYKAMSHSNLYKLLIETVLKDNSTNEEILEIVDVLIHNKEKFEIDVLEISLLKSLKHSLIKNEKPYYIVLFNLAINFSTSQTFYHDMDDPEILYDAYLKSRQI